MQVLNLTRAAWQGGGMHLIPADRAHLHTIDEHRVCDAIAGLGTPQQLDEWAQRFSVLADPSRLALLLGIRSAPDICVTDLAVAVGMKDPAVSQALRLMRALGLVTQRRDGRVIRYRLTDSPTNALLGQVHPEQPALAAADH
jgi:ArsR family transcriptional regulator, lead/cadmium/zinc/bismuth-responsive transcriptional repressor